MPKSLNVLMLIALLGLMPLNLLAQEETSPKKSAESAATDQEGDADEQQQDDDSEQSEQDSDDETGRADLDEAFDLKINAKSTRDLDRVADLCESAIEKGLDESAEKQARQLWASVLYDHAKQLQRRIAPGGTLSTRWRWLRREAISRLNKAIEVNPEKIDALILLAQLHSLNAGDQDVARESIEKAIAKIKDDPEKLSEALFIRSRLAEDKKARMADLSQAVKINPKNFEALMQRAMIFLEDEKSDEAIADFKAMLEIDKNIMSRYLAVANELRRRSMFKEAIEILDKAVEVAPKNVKVLVLRSRCYIGVEDEDAALEDLNAVLDAERQNLEARELRTRVLIAKEKYKEAMQDANELIQQQPEESVGLELRSLVHQASGELGKAIEDTEQLLDKDPENLNFKFNLAILHSANEEPSKAIPIFDVILRNVVETAQPQILRNRGDAYLSIGKHARAIDDYEMALDVFEELNANEEEAEMSERDKEVKSGLLNNLAWVLATSPEDDLRDGERSIELAIEASELTDYKAAYILSTLASGYAEEGDFDTAKKWAKKAVELAEDDEQRKGLQEELDSYEKDEAWRELENVEADKAEREKKEKEAEEQKAKDQDEDKQDDESEKPDADSDKDESSDDDNKEDDGDDDGAPLT